MGVKQVVEKTPIAVTMANLRMHKYLHSSKVTFLSTDGLFYLKMLKVRASLSFHQNPLTKPLTSVLSKNRFLILLTSLHVLYLTKLRYKYFISYDEGELVTLKALRAADQRVK